MGAYASRARRQVRSLVVSLAVFVPGHSAINQVLPWVTKPLGLPDLAKVRLAGYSKRLPLSRVLEVRRHAGCPGGDARASG